MRSLSPYLIGAALLLAGCGSQPPAPAPADAAPKAAAPKPLDETPAPSPKESGELAPRSTATKRRP